MSLRAKLLAVIGGQVIFQNGMRARQGQIAAIDLPSILTCSNAFTEDEAAANIALVGEISNPAQRLLVQDVFAQSLRNVRVFDACLLGVRFIVSSFVKKKKLSGEHVETEVGLDNTSG